MSDKVAAEQFKQQCKALGFTYALRQGTVISVRKTFTPKDNDTYQRLRSEAYSLVAIIRRTTLGTTWGCDGIGEYVALENGVVEVMKSGCSKRILQNLR